MRNPGEARLAQFRVKKRLKAKCLEEMRWQREPGISQVVGASRHRNYDPSPASHTSLGTFFKLLKACYFRTSESTLTKKYF